jgi:aminoglycoside phosphotransferase (APT) family kinase protein
MPRTLLADFTHQLIDRDYIFQTYLSGDRWDQISDRFTPEEKLRLWEQFGSLTKTIHDTHGTAFGGPYPAPEFPTWSQTVLYRLESALQAMVEEQLDVTSLRSVLESVENHAALLDGVTQPCLLHGDLWLFNILVSRGLGGPTISGILDADRAWWGDPLADWTMFVLAMEAPEKHPGHARFWQAYGAVEQTPETGFRQAVYEAMHIGSAMAWASKHDDVDTVQRGTRDLRAVLERLRSDGM